MSYVTLSGLLGPELLPNGINLVDSNSDGRADGFTWLSSYTCDCSIVTGNGFSGRAQRSLETNAIHYATIATTPAVNVTIGKTYRIKGSYRSSGNFVLNKSSGPNIIILGTTNTGNAVAFDKTFVATDFVGWYLAVIGYSTWFEVGNLSLKEVYNTKYVTLPDILGPELIVNGGFDSDSNWAKEQATITITGGKLVCASTGCGYTAKQVCNSIIAGERYRVRYEVSEYVSGSYRFDVRGLYGTAYTGNRSVDEIVVAGNYAISQFRFVPMLCASPYNTYKIDNISVQRVYTPYVTI